MSDRIRYIAALGAAMTLVFKKETIEQVVDLMMTSKEGRLTLKQITFSKMQLGKSMTSSILVQSDSIEHLVTKVTSFMDNMVSTHFAIPVISGIPELKEADLKPIFGDKNVCVPVMQADGETVVYEFPPMPDYPDIPIPAHQPRRNDFRSSVRPAPTEISLADLPVRRGGGGGIEDGGPRFNSIGAIAPADQSSTSPAMATKTTSTTETGSSSMPASAVCITETSSKAVNSVEGKSGLARIEETFKLTAPELREGVTHANNDLRLVRGTERLLTWFAQDIGVKEINFDLTAVADRITVDDWLVLESIVGQNINVRPYRKRMADKARTAARRGADEFAGFIHEAVRTIIAEAKGVKDETFA